MAWGSKNGDVTGSTRSMGASSGLSFIGAEVILNGNISGNGDIHLDGVIEGDLSCNSLILGAGGQVKGNIIAEKAVIGGAVLGTINATTLTIEKSARISGDLAYEHVSIEAGAQIDGRMSHRVTLDSNLKLVSANGE
jgi:cytoskeletal protein CcmA (bactofilin family)